MTFMEMSALPSALFIKKGIADINPIYFALMLNFLIAFILCFVWKKLFISDWYFGLSFDGIKDGLRKYGFTALIAAAIVTLAFYIGLAPFDNTPTALRVVVEGIVYYIGVAIMEELYLRGLLQNVIEKWLGERKNAALYAVVITSVLFGAGHIFGALGQPVVTVVAKTVWAAALGVYFGAVYVKTKNLWVPIILHFLVDLCGIPFCFSTSNQYPTVSLIACLVSFTLLGIYGAFIIVKKPED